MYFLEPGKVSSVNRKRVRPSVVLFCGLIELVDPIEEKKEERRDMMMI